MKEFEDSRDFDSGRDEREFQERLRSSVDVPEMPADVDERIRNRVLGQFDSVTAVSPASQDRLPSCDSGTSRRRHPWLQITVAAMCVVCAVFLLSPSEAYSFESMLQAIREKPLVKAVMGSSSVVESIGWSFGTTNNLSAVESRNAVSWWDEDRNRMLRFERQSGEIQQASDIQDPATQLLDLLRTLRSLGDDPSRVVSESWKKVDGFIELTVSLRPAGADVPQQTVTYVFGLDPETQLPKWVRIPGIQTSSVNVDYPSEGPKSLVSLGVTEAAMAAFRAATSLVAESSVGTDIVAEESPAEPVRTAAMPEDSTGTGSADDSEDPFEPNEPKEASEADISATEETVPTRVAARRWQSTVAVEVPNSTQGMTNLVDRRLDELWSDRGVQPAKPAGEYELIRRLYLDLTGRVPLVQEIKDAQNASPQQSTNRLLQSRNFSNHMATVWSRLLLPDSVDLSRFGGVEAFSQWLAAKFEDNVGYDQIIRDLLQAEGRVGRSGPVLFYTALELKPDSIAKQTARVFLGSRIDCAQCHDHPIDDWTQQDFWGYAAFFARISRPEGRMEEISSVLRVRDVPRGNVMLPNTNVVIDPRFPGGELFEEAEGEALRRRALAEWLTGSRQFARATVNHVWAHLFGIGMVNPADDFGPHNAAIAPQLLDELAEYFVDTKFDLRELIRTITASQAYQLSSRAEDQSDDRARCYAQMNVKWLTAEQLYDALTTAARSTQAPQTSPAMSTLGEMDSFSRAEFLEKFRAPRGSATVYQAGIPQALSLMNGALTSFATAAETSGMMRALTAPFFTDTQRLETLFLAVVSRPPAAEELESIVPLLKAATDANAKQEVLSDVFWALLNTAEFASNH